MSTVRIVNEETGAEIILYTNWTPGRIAQMVELADESTEHRERLFGLQGLSPFTVNHRYDGMPVRRDVAS